MRLAARTEAEDPEAREPAPRGAVKFDLAPGATLEVQGSGAARYTVKHCADGAYSCTCPAWRNQGSRAPQTRTCKHLRALRGADAENARVSAAMLAHVDASLRSFLKW